MGDPLRLVALVVGVVADDGLAFALVGPQLLGLAAHVVGDDGVGRVEDGLRGPVVLLEHEHADVGEGVLELQDVADVGAAEVVDAVVHQQPVGHVGVGARHLEVVDRPVVLVDRDGLDLDLLEAVDAGHEHAHAHMQVGERQEVVGGGTDLRPSPDVEAPGVRDRPRQGHGLGIAAAAGLEAVGAGETARAHADPGLDEARRDVGTVRRPLHPVVPDTGATVAEHGEVERLTPAAVVGAAVGEVGVQQQVGHELLGTDLGVELAEQPLEQDVVHGKVTLDAVEAPVGRP